jgi:hypothetical protein
MLRSIEEKELLGVIENPYTDDLLLSVSAGEKKKQVIKLEDYNAEKK